jgi:hypothetical protein
MLAVHQLYQLRPILEMSTVFTARAEIPDTERITIGDVWDALEARGLRADGAGTGHADFQLRGNRHLDIPNRTFME